MKVSIRVIKTAASILLMAGIEAQAAWHSGTINRIQTDSAGSLIVYIDSTVNHECGGNRVQYSAPNTQAMRTTLAALLAWEAQAKVVQFLISSCSEK